MPARHESRSGVAEIVVDDLGGTIDFSRALGLELEGRTTPDGRFVAPPAVADHRNAPVNALGYLRVMFTVEDIDQTLEKWPKNSADSTE